MDDYLLCLDERCPPAGESPEFGGGPVVHLLEDGPNAAAADPADGDRLW
jgi:hypothetical protein